MAQNIVLVSGATLEVDAEGPVSGKSSHDAEADGYVYHATDAKLIYIHLTGAGIWSDGMPFSGYANETGNEYLLDRENHTGEQGIDTITDLATKLDTIAKSGIEGGFAPLDEGIKIPADYLPEVLSTILSGLSLLTATPVTDVDSILGAIGKLQAQLNAARTPNPSLVNTIYYKVTPTTVTLTTGTPLQISGLASQAIGAPLVITGGTFPTGIVSGATYYLVDLGGGLRGLALTPGGTPINTSGSTSGTKTANSPPYVKSTHDVKFVIVELLGGGGGGGGSAHLGAGGGGQAGGICRKKIMAADLLSSESITIGLGGAGGAATGAKAGNGAASSFGSHCSALGGEGGAGPTAAGLAGLGGGGTFSLGGTNGDFMLAGNPGTHGSALPGAYQFVGLGGTGYFAGAASSNTYLSTSQPVITGWQGWSNSGCGGGGSAVCIEPNSQAGQPGGSGMVIVHEYA